MMFLFVRCGLLIRRHGEMERSGANFFDHGAMLLIQPELQGVFTIGVQREQILIGDGAAVKNASVEINGRINDGMSGATVFRLDVVGDAGNRHVGVVTEKHFRIRSDLREGWRKPGRNLSAAFDRVADESLL